MVKDFEKLAYDLALQYSHAALLELSDTLNSFEEKNDALLKSFKLSYDYLCEELGVTDK